jgi:hypothetical protein
VLGRRGDDAAHTCFRLNYPNRKVGLRQVGRAWTVLPDADPTQLGSLEAAAKRHGVEMETTADITRAPECLWKAAYGYHDSGTEAVEQQVGGQARRLPMKRVNEASNDALITCLLLAPGPPPSHNQVDSLYPLR